MRPPRFKQTIGMVALGVLGWALCGAVMFAGMSFISLEMTLILHAVAAPVIFSAISWFYFTRLKYASPLQTAVAFFLIVVSLDFFVVALIINRSLEMFQSLLGTWIPFALIFLSTYVTGVAVKAQAARRRTAG